MSFGDFMRKIGKKLKPPQRIRDWRQQKRQYRAWLRDLGQDAQAVRRGVREWVKKNPKPKRTKEEREKIYSDIPQLYEEGRELFKGKGGAEGVNSASFTGMTTPTVRRVGFNPLFLLLLIPVLFPKFLKNF